MAHVRFCCICGKEIEGAYKIHDKNYTLFGDGDACDDCYRNWRLNNKEYLDAQIIKKLKGGKK